ncbi:UNVERIFIED_CONTAM: hypothetical protein BEN50_19410 [Euhalothece sp. KZN 001]
MSIQTWKQDQNSNPKNNLRLSGITWEQFKKLENSFPAIAGTRLIDLDGVLEIVILGEVKASKIFPFLDLNLIPQLIQQSLDIGETATLKQFRQWVRENAE